MEHVVLVSVALKLFIATTAAIVVFLVLRLFDWRSKIIFHHVMEEIRRDPKAAAIILGLRFVGVCLLFGLILS